MSRWKFAIDREYTMWDRYYYEIEANDYEEAESLMKEEFENPTFEDANGQVAPTPLHDTLCDTEREELLYIDVYDSDSETLIESHS